MPLVLLVGCGETGCRVAQLEQSSGNPVLGIVRSASAHKRLKSLQIPSLQIDLDEKQSFWREEWNGSWVYYFVPPLNTPPTDSHLISFFDPRLLILVNHFSLQVKPSKVVLISTTGVYGNCDGQWINEDSPTKPQTVRAKRRLTTEVVLQVWSKKYDFSETILRVAAIYGPGRFPLDKIRQGQPVLPLEESPWSNRIHLDDLAQVCFLAMRNGKPSSLYNVSDGHPLRMTDYFFQVADHFHLPKPPILPLAEARLHWTPEFFSYWEESKRLENHRLLEDLQLQLKYPTLQSGLRAEQ